jgi:Arc/MetJ-type ribon-helix-helix transcriptional regulator
MADQTVDLNAEVNAFAAPFIAEGRYDNASEVLHAAMDAFRLAQFSNNTSTKSFSSLPKKGKPAARRKAM